MFCCAVDCLSPVLSCKAASSNQQGTERFQNEGTLGVVQREDSKYTCNVCPASALAISQQGNKKLLLFASALPCSFGNSLSCPLVTETFQSFFLLLGNSNVSLFGLAEFTAPQCVDIFGNRM